MIDHDDLHFQPIVILAPDGETQVHEHIPADQISRDSYTPWTAGESGNHYLVYHSPDGDTGSYALTILPGTPGNDDHGDTPGSSTRITVDRMVSGSLDHAADFDHFRFRAKRGQDYEIKLNYLLHQMPEARLWLFKLDDMTQVHRFVDRGRTGSGKYLEWTARNSGDYIVAAWSREGDIGDYTLEVRSGLGR